MGVDFLQASMTALLAYIVFVLGQITTRFFIEPVHNLDKLIGEIADTLIYYSNVITDPPRSRDRVSVTDASYRDEVSENLRKKATLLSARVQMVRGHGVFEALRLIPERSSINKARDHLIFLSNNIRRDFDPHENSRVKDEIFDLLKIKYE